MINYKRNTVLFLMLFIASHLVLKGQIKNEIKASVTVNILMPGATFQEYDSTSRGKRIFSNQSQVKSSTPEELLASIFSADNQKWVNFNYYKPEQAEKFSKKDYKERFNKNIDTNYFELVHKLEFSYNAVPTAYIKYWFVKEGKRISLHSCTIQKYGDRWFLVSIPELKDQQRLMERIKTDMFVTLYRGRGTKDNMLEQLIANTRGTSNVLDISKLLDYLQQWENENDLELLRHFCDGY